MPFASFIPAGLSLATSIIGGEQARQAGDRGYQRSKELMKKALMLYKDINAPTIEEQELALETPDYIGDYDPSLERNVGEIGPSELKQIDVDPRLKEAQMQALAQLSDVVNTGGMTDADKASYELVRRGASGEAQARNQALLQEMQARGQGGSGAELISRLQANQAGADRMQQAALQNQIAARQRALEAVSQSGNMAGNIRTQDFGEQARIAEAQDIINRTNKQNAQSIEQRNVGSKNQAGLRNIDTRQGLEGTRANISNQQQIANKGLISQQFDQNMRLAGAKSGIITGQAQSAAQQGANQAAGTGQLWQGVSTGLTDITKELMKNKDKTTTKED